MYAVKPHLAAISNTVKMYYMALLRSSFLTPVHEVSLCYISLVCNTAETSYSLNLIPLPDKPHYSMVLGLAVEES